MQSPSLILKRLMMGPLLSDLEWKSLAYHPCKEPLYRRVVMSCLLPRILSRNCFCSFFVAHLEFTKNFSIILVSFSSALSFGIGYWISGTTSAGLDTYSSNFFYRWFSSLALAYCNSAAMSLAFSVIYISLASSSKFLAVSWSTIFCKGFSWVWQSPRWARPSNYCWSLSILRLRVAMTSSFPLSSPSFDLRLLISLSLALISFLSSEISLFFSWVIAFITSFLCFSRISLI